MGFNAQAVEAKRALAAEKAAAVKGVMQRHHAAGEPKPRHEMVRAWVKALGYKNGLSSKETQILIVEVWGAGRAPKPEPKPEKKAKSHDLDSIIRRLDRIEDKLTQLYNLWK